MTQELIYTSAPSGLKPGSRGFCTVVTTQGMPTNLIDRLEALSGYRHVYGGASGREVIDQIVYQHVRFNVGGRNLHLLSRIHSAGVDYSQRSNKFAHHVLLDVAELPATGPAWLLSQPGFMQNDWDGKPKVLPTGRVVPAGQSTPGVCRAWAAKTGDAGWGGVLAETAIGTGKKGATIVVPQGFDPLPLFAESLALLPQEQRWNVSFSTYFTRLPPGIDCAWRCVLEGSPEAATAMRAPQGLFVNLCQPLPKAMGAFAKQARTGRPVNSPGPAPPRRQAIASADDAELGILLARDATDERESKQQREPALVVDEGYVLVPVPPPLKVPVAVLPPISFKRKENSTPWLVAGAALAFIVLCVVGTGTWFVTTSTLRTAHKVHENSMVNNRSAEQIAMDSRKSEKAGTTQTTEPIKSEPTKSEPIKSEPIKSEPIKSEPIKSEPIKSEPIKSEPIKSEPIKSEPIKSEPIKSEPIKSEPIKSEPIKSEPIKSEPIKSEPIKSEPIKSEPIKSEPIKSEPTKSEPTKSEPTKSEPTKSEPTKSEPTKSEPTKSEPTKSEPTKSEPTKSEPTKSEPTKSEPTKSEPTKSDEMKFSRTRQEVSIVMPQAELSRAEPITPILLPISNVLPENIQVIQPEPGFLKRGSYRYEVKKSTKDDSIFIIQALTEKGRKQNNKSTKWDIASLTFKGNQVDFLWLPISDPLDGEAPDPYALLNCVLRMQGPAAIHLLQLRTTQTTKPISPKFPMAPDHHLGIGRIVLLDYSEQCSSPQIAVSSDFIGDATVETSDESVAPNSYDISQKIVLASKDKRFRITYELKYKHQPNKKQSNDRSFIGTLEYKSLDAPDVPRNNDDDRNYSIFRSTKNSFHVSRSPLRPTLSEVEKLKSDISNSLAVLKDERKKSENPIRRKEINQSIGIAEVDELNVTSLMEFMNSILKSKFSIQFRIPLEENLVIVLVQSENLDSQNNARKMSELGGYPANASQ